MRSILGGVKHITRRTPLWLLLACFIAIFCDLERGLAAILPTKTFCRFVGSQGYLLAEDAANIGWDAYPQHGKVWLGYANGYGRWAYLPNPLTSSDWFRTGFSTKLSNSYPYSFTFYPQPENVQLNINILTDDAPKASWTAAASPDPGLQIVREPSVGTIADTGATFQYTVDLTKIPRASPPMVYTDTFTYYVTDSTIEHLPSALTAECVLGTVCYYGFGDTNRSRLVTVTATISDNRAAPAAERASARASGESGRGEVQTGVSCAVVNANRTMEIPCITVAGDFYQITLHAYLVQSDPSGDYWSLGSFAQATDNGRCASFDSGAMTVSLPCVTVNNMDYSISLNHHENISDPNGVYWSLGAVQPLADTSLSAQSW